MSSKQVLLIRKQNIFLIVVTLYFLLPLNTLASDKYEGEKIVYAISPLGKSEYKNLGVVDYKGQKLNLVTFRTKVPGFDDLEEIYSDPSTGLPTKVIRNISWPLSKEYLIEDYFPNTNSLRIRKFKNNRLIKEYNFKADGPMHNAILLPFYLRTIRNPPIGWSMKVRFPQEFKVTLVSIEEVKVPAGKFFAYHFKSSPAKFEIWISKDGVPVKIKGLDGLGYTMYMESHVYRKNGP